MRSPGAGRVGGWRVRVACVAEDHGSITLDTCHVDKRTDLGKTGRLSPSSRYPGAAVDDCAELGGRLVPATVAECHRLISAVLRAAVRDRLISTNPCDGVRVPRRRRKDIDVRTITRAELINRLLPALPDRHRALVGLAGGTGLRWGECVGLRWDSVELDAGYVHVVRVAVEVAGRVTTKAYPKSKAGRRSVPLPAFVVDLLRAHRGNYSPGPAGEVFTNPTGGPLRRTLFRPRDWRPALVRAGLLGKVTQTGPHTYRAACLLEVAAAIRWSP